MKQLSKKTSRKPIRRISHKEQHFLERLDKTEFHPFVKNAIALFDSLGEFIKDSTPLMIAVLIYIAVRILLP